MVETRIAPRVRVMKAAKIEYGGDKYLVPCAIYPPRARRWIFRT